MDMASVRQTSGKELWDAGRYRRPHNSQRLALMLCAYL